MGFRVLTPHTAQLAAFKENSSAYAGPVVDGKALDIKDDGGSIILIRCLSNYK